jgi:hypothetical protein
MPTADNLTEMTWSDRRREEQRHFAALKEAATKRIDEPQPPAAPVPSFRQTQRNLARVLDAAGIAHAVPANGRIIHREVDR